MGFWNLHLFNIAMLGKVGWRLEKDHNALVSWVLKAKYFPRGCFLTAAIGRKPNFTWRSIWEARDLVRRCTRLKSGSGSEVIVRHLSLSGAESGRLLYHREL
ncbi:hypothetical protein ACS0TY_011552 [Phlomoides rotata]